MTPEEGAVQEAYLAAIKSAFTVLIENAVCKEGAVGPRFAKAVATAASAKTVALDALKRANLVEAK